MRPIDADDLPNRKFAGVATWTPTESDSWQRGWNDAIDTIVKLQPTIDSVPVVMCKDCKNSRGKIANRTKCGLHNWGVGFDYFCADGERKDDE